MLSDDVPHVIARNSESNLSTNGSACRAYFGATEAEVNNNVEIAIAPNSIGQLPAEAFGKLGTMQPFRFGTSLWSRLGIHPEWPGGRFSS